MKILIANWVYNWGSTGFIARDLKNELKRMGHEVRVAASRAEDCDDDPEVFVFTKPSEWKFYWRLHRVGFSKMRGNKKATKRLIDYMKQEKADVVNLHLLHGNRVDFYYLLKWLGQHDIKTVVTNHAEIYYTGCCGHAYDCMRWVTDECRGCAMKKMATGARVFPCPHKEWRRMHKAFSWFKPGNLSFTAVSPWVQSRFFMSPIMKEFPCSVTLNGLDVGIFYRRENFVSIKKRITDAPYILWVTASFNPTNKADVKGSWYMMELAKMMPEQKFVVVATSSMNSDNIQSNVMLWGKAKDQSELAELYSGASLTVLVSRRETFSMVTAESLCCGTPVVGFKAGGPETIAIPEYSCFVEQGSVKALAGAVREMLNKEFDRKRISEEAREKYSPQAMAKQYLEAYESVLTNGCPNNR